MRRMRVGITVSAGAALLVAAAAVARAQTPLVSGPASAGTPASPAGPAVTTPTDSVGSSGTVSSNAAASAAAANSNTTSSNVSPKTSPSASATTPSNATPAAGAAASPMSPVKNSRPGPTAAQANGEPPSSSVVDRSRFDPAPAGQKYWVVQVQILEIDDQGQPLVLAEPVLQTTGSATGVAISPEDGRRFEFHFASITPDQANAASLLLGSTNDAPRPQLGPQALESQRLLDRNVTVSVEQQSRQAVLAHVAEQVGLSLSLDSAAAKTHAVELQRVISFQAEALPLYDVLDQLVEPLKLRYRVEDGRLLLSPPGKPGPLATGPISAVPMVSSPLPSGPAGGTLRASPAATGTRSGSPLLSTPGDRLNGRNQSPAGAPILDEGTAATGPRPLAENLNIATYSVADLVKDATDPEEAMRVLVLVVQANVTPQAWQSRGGQATVKSFASTQSLIVRHSPRGHEAVKRFLDVLRSPDEHEDSGTADRGGRSTPPAKLPSTSPTAPSAAPTGPSVPPASSPASSTPTVTPPSSSSSSASPTPSTPASPTSSTAP
jgi:hypothetical protein